MGKQPPQSTSKLRNSKLETRNSKLGTRYSVLSPVIRHRLRMDEHAKKLGRILLKADLQIRLNIVHPRQWQIVGQGAMTGNVQPSSHPLDLDLMHVEHFRKLRRNRLQPAFQRCIADNLISRLDRRRLALDMRQDR